MKYIAALLLFGLNGIVASYITLNSYEIVFLRTLIGSILLIAIFLITKSKTQFYMYKRQLGSISVSGAAMGMSWMFLYEAYQKIGVGIASLAYYCGPIIVMALSPFIFREKLTWVKVVSFLCVLLGVFFVNGQAIGDGGESWGLFCGMMSAIMYAAMVIFNKKAKNITGLENSMLQLFISFLTVAVFVGIKQNFIIEISISDIIPIFILGLINTGVGCYFYFSSISYLPVQTLAICGYLEPLSAVIFSILFLKETMVPIQVVGAVFILVGAIFGELFNTASKECFNDWHNSEKQRMKY